MDQALFRQMCDEFLVQSKRLLASEPYAYTLSGSIGKGTADGRSDYDFRLYYEKAVEPAAFYRILGEIGELVREWTGRGFVVDSVWPRSISEIDEGLDRWLSGQGTLVPLEWTVWGYNLLTDIYNQKILDDPFGIAQRWKDRLTPYPDVVRKTILDRCVSSLRYWRGDYHYRNKADRGDLPFLASLTARLVNDVLQALFALNRVYYPGDGSNLVLSRHLANRPGRLEERVEAILYPENGALGIGRQYADLLALIDETLALAEQA